MSLCLITSPCNETSLPIQYFLFVHRIFCTILEPICSSLQLRYDYPFPLSSLMRVFFYWYYDWSFSLLISTQQDLYPVFFQFSYHIFTSMRYLPLTLNCIFSFMFMSLMKLPNTLNRHIRDFVSLYKILLNTVYQESTLFFSISRRIIFIDLPHLRVFWITSEVFFLFLYFYCRIDTLKITVIN